MTKIMTIWISLVFICHFSVLISGAGDEKKLYSKVGGEVAFDPGAPAGAKPITSIVWMFGNDLAVEWYAGEVEAYGHFKGRCQLDITTGVLTFKGLTLEDSGWYAADINNKRTSRTRLQVMFPVPKPTVSASCDSGFNRCKLTCDGNTTHAELVTYRWTTGDPMWMPSSKELNITGEENCDVIEFSCTMINQVSEERSESISNPLRVRLRLGTISAAVTFVLFVPVVTGLICWYKAGKPGGADKEPADKPRNKANGAAADQAAQQSEEMTPMKREGIAEDA